MLFKEKYRSTKEEIFLISIFSFSNIKETASMWAYASSSKSIRECYWFLCMSILHRICHGGIKLAKSHPTFVFDTPTWTPSYGNDRAHFPWNLCLTGRTGGRGGEEEEEAASPPGSRGARASRLPKRKRGTPNGATLSFAASENRCARLPVDYRIDNGVKNGARRRRRARKGWEREDVSVPLCSLFAIVSLLKTYLPAGAMATSNSLSWPQISRRQSLAWLVCRMLIPDRAYLVLVGNC